MAGAYAAKAMPDQLFLALAVAILVGAVAEAVNGFVVSILDVPPVHRHAGNAPGMASGLAYVIGGGARINGLPQNFSQFANTEILGLTIPVILMIIGIVGFGIMMRRTKFGMHVYAVGGNEAGLRIAGIKTGRVKFLVYTISGALAGVSGIMLASRARSTARPASASATSSTRSRRS